MNAIRLHTISRAIVAAVAVAAASCASEAPQVDVKGSCADVHGSQVCTWAKTSGSALVEAGALVPIASIDNVPAQPQMAWPPPVLARIGMPESVRTQSGFGDLTVYWEPMGHPPGPYLTPHFDFHFYTIPSAEREAIDCKDESKPTAIPANYALPDFDLPPDMAKFTGVPRLIGLCVPAMGMHSILDTELKGTEAFRSTMVVGYYKGKPIFIEPMVSRAMLMEKKSFELPIPDIPGMGAHPSKFRAEYDNAQNAYRFTFSAFKPGA